MSFRSQNNALLIDYFRENEMLIKSNKSKRIKKSKLLDLKRANRRDSKTKEILPTL